VANSGESSLPWPWDATQAFKMLMVEPINIEAEKLPLTENQSSWGFACLASLVSGSVIFQVIQATIATQK
jgi:hypothetical protein